MEDNMSKLKATTYGAILLLGSTMFSSAAYANNMLVNGGFEADVMPNYGNNVGSTAPTGWTLSPGLRPNLVKVDGPGGQANWYTTGPNSDGTMAGSGVTRQYFDVTTGRGSLYQTFTSSCTGRVTFGGSFSNRGGSASGSVSIRQGAGTGGAVVGQSQTVNISSGNPVDRPWVSRSSTANVQQGQTYSFVVTMNDNANFDEGFVTPDRFRCTMTAEVLDDRPVLDIADPLPVFDKFPPVPDGEHYQCYILEKSSQLKSERITVQDQFGRNTVVLGRPGMICNPSMKIHKDKVYNIQNDERHLVCYTYERPGKTVNEELRVQTQFGKDEVIATRPMMFCAPAGKNHVKK